MTDLSIEDAAIARKQGDLRQLLLMAAGFDIAAPKQSTPDPMPEPPQPRARPGAWPTGSSPPGPVAPMSAAAINAGLEDYRQWYLAGRPKCDEHCDCGGCPTPPPRPDHTKERT